MFILRLTLCAIILGWGLDAQCKTSTLDLTRHYGWLLLRYGKITPTQYQFGPDNLLVRVNKSASPLVYPFAKPQALKRIALKAALLSVPGHKADKDDFILRIGPAFSGDKSLNVFQRLLAPDWIVRLDKIAKNSGEKLGHLELSLVAIKDAAPVWKQRTHPDSDLIRENVVMFLESPESFELNIEYSKSTPRALGIWIGADGDDTNSNFSLRIDELKIETYDDNL